MKNCDLIINIINLNNCDYKTQQIAKEMMDVFYDSLKNKIKTHAPLLLNRGARYSFIYFFTCE